MTIFIVPAGFYAVFAAWVVEDSKVDVYLFEGKTKESKFYEIKYYKLSKTIGYLTLTCNLISCFVMVLVLRLIKKMTAPVKLGA